MGDPPQLVPTCLPDSFEGGGLIFWLSREVVEFLEQRYRDGKKPPALFLGVR